MSHRALILSATLIGIGTAVAVRAAPHIISREVTALLLAASLGGIMSGVGIRPNNLRVDRIIVGMVCAALGAIVVYRG